MPKAKIEMIAIAIQIEIMISARLLRFLDGGGVNSGGVP